MFLPNSESRKAHGHWYKTTLKTATEMKIQVNSHWGDQERTCERRETNKKHKILISSRCRTLKGQVRKILI
jgi:hypothetical protein